MTISISSIRLTTILKNRLRESGKNLSNAFKLGWRMWLSISNNGRWRSGLNKIFWHLVWSIIRISWLSHCSKLFCWFKIQLSLTFIFSHGLWVIIVKLSNKKTLLLFPKEEGKIRIKTVTTASSMQSWSHKRSVLFFSLLFLIQISITSGLTTKSMKNSWNFSLELVLTCSKIQ